MRERTCHFCGEELTEDSFDYAGRRHWLSDCRPDLVEHEEGPLCTWGPKGCYAFQDEQRNWTTEHVHFYPDGRMS